MASPPTCRLRAHPRAGGENLSPGPRTTARRGSSPRRQGKPAQTTTARRSQGLIPAQAGKTVYRSNRHHGAGAHPRAGGENFLVWVELGGDVGSSPRRRGKLGGKKGDVPKPGLIPAQAGKTRRPGRTRWRRPAHPRAGGENMQHLVATASAAGSSPRRRGKRDTSEGQRALERLIPAQAGKTSSL